MQLAPGVVTARHHRTALHQSQRVGAGAPRAGEFERFAVRIAASNVVRRGPATPVTATGTAPCAKVRRPRRSGADGWPFSGPPAATGAIAAAMRPRMEARIIEAPVDTAAMSPLMAEPMVRGVVTGAWATSFDREPRPTSG